MYVRMYACMYTLVCMYIYIYTHLRVDMTVSYAGYVGFHSWLPSACLVKQHPRAPCIDIAPTLGLNSCRYNLL